MREVSVQRAITSVRLGFLRAVFGTTPDPIWHTTLPLRSDLPQRAVHTHPI